MWVCFGCKTESYGLDFQLSPLRWYRAPENVVKIRPNYFSTVLTGNDRNWTRNHVGMFRVPNVVIWAWFSTLATPVVPGPEKVVKILSKHFFAILIGNDKNCTAKSVVCLGAIPSHLALFLTFPAPVVPVPEKVVKICPRPFLHVQMRNDKKWVPNRVGMFWVPKPSHPGPIFNFACSGGDYARKSRQNSTETGFSSTNGKR